MYHYEKALKASDIVWSVSISAVVWSSVLISVTWVELLWAVCKFFRISNRPKMFVCRVPQISATSWRNCAAEFQISVDLLCGTTAVETFERWTFWMIQQTQIDSWTSFKSWNMYALRRFSKLLKLRWTLYEERIKDLSKRLRTHESPRELVIQSEAKR